MGVLARRMEQRRGDFLSDEADEELWSSRQTPAGIRVNRAVALSLTTIWRCVDLLASAVSQAPKDVIVKVGGQSYPEYRNRPKWLTSPNPADQTYTVNDYFNEIALSTLIDGEYFVQVTPYVGDPAALVVTPASRVKVRPGPEYDILDSQGREVRTLGPMEMLHGWWLRPAGELRGISPLEALRRGIGSAVAAEDFGGRFFGQGAALSFGVEVPGKLTDAKKAELRESLKKKYAGLSNSHAIGVLSEGAKFVPNLAPTPEQAQMLATRKFSVEDLARAFGVPPGMVGSQEPGASSFASAETYHQEFRDYAVLPLAVRIEAQHNRLLSVPASVNDPFASVQFKFNLDHVARTNLKDRYDAYSKGILGGFLKPRDVRNREDLQPLSDGSDDTLFMQQQMIPINSPLRGGTPQGAKP